MIFGIMSEPGTVRDLTGCRVIFGYQIVDSVSAIRILISHDGRLEARVFALNRSL